jgi:hypothetical protein
MAAALEHQHLAAALRELVGQRRAGGAGADDHDVGCDRFARDIAWRHARHGSLRRRHRADVLVLRLALRERDVARPGRRVLVAVVAEKAELLRGADQRPPDVA